MNQKVVLKIGNYKKPLVFWSIFFLFLIISVMPDDFFVATSIYHSGTPNSIDYVWLDYHFSFLFIPFVIAFFFSKSRSVQCAKVLLFLIILRSFIFLSFGRDSILSDKTFELIFTIIVGLGYFLCVVKLNKYLDNEEQFNLFEFFCFVQLLTQMMGAILNFSGFSNRYNAVNLDVEGTGYLYCFYLLVILIKKPKYSNIKFVIFFFGLLLTGSRIALILLFMFCLLIFLSSHHDFTRLTKIKPLTLSIILFLVLIVILMVFFASKLDFISIFFSGIDRFFDIFNGTDTSGDGRLRSIKAGFEIIKNNYSGLDFGFIFLQKAMRFLGYPTFPHSYFLIYRILSGPLIFWLFIFFMLKDICSSYRQKNLSIILLLFFFCWLLITGSPLVNFKMVMILVWSFSIIKGNSYGKKDF